MKTALRKGKVALLGNMNNILFNLTRYLRDEGYDAHLFIFPSEPAHFHPQADTFDAGYTEYVHRLTWGNPFDLMTTPVSTIKKDLDGFTRFIACGTGPAYLAKAGITVDLLAPYGSDLYELPFFKLVRPTKLLHYLIFTFYQKMGIREARNLTVADNADLFTRTLAKLRFKGKRLMSGLPFVYTQQYAPDKIKDNSANSQHYASFKKIRDAHDLVIIHNSRHCWKNEPDPISLKDNDKLFRGLAIVLTRRPGVKIAIVTFEYGHDVEASKALCRELGIEKHVFWFPLMPRKELMLGMSLSDVVAGEFRNSWFTYGVVFEAMALAKPVMHYREDSLYKEMELYPMIYAKETEDIVAALTAAIDDKTKLENIGKEAKDWYERNITKQSLRDVAEILDR
ncbi:glycosyltransferase [Fulvivirgaceae bacterium PWU4]|uniref:Glycosyltransferase n=1 Tax=Chryseosolibacter histidini TaxID=2782349 RepID=A0AAP2DT95_9BACT|nr:glycosyltransferase [Chryseosolibacter histidini]MBT1700918.1 glycosyltransferase [Chryseosolibacter histidini]